MTGGLRLRVSRAGPCRGLPLYSNESTRPLHGQTAFAGVLLNNCVRLDST
jgi:hypothetical protein